jgi:hypothetical protein
MTSPFGSRDVDPLLIHGAHEAYEDAYRSLRISRRRTLVAVAMLGCVFALAAFVLMLRSGLVTVDAIAGRTALPAGGALALFVAGLLVVAVVFVVATLPALGRQVDCGAAGAAQLAFDEYLKTPSPSSAMPVSDVRVVPRSPSTGRGA